MGNIHRLASSRWDVVFRLNGSEVIMWKGARNAEIEKLHSEGMTFAALARQFNLSPSRVTQIVVKTRRMRKRLQARLDASLRHTT